jgi:hypothetical protein
MTVTPYRTKAPKRRCFIPPAGGVPGRASCECSGWSPLGGAPLASGSRRARSSALKANDDRPRAEGLACHGLSHPAEPGSCHGLSPAHACGQPASQRRGGDSNPAPSRPERPRASPISANCGVGGPQRPPSIRPEGSRKGSRSRAQAAVQARIRCRRRWCRRGAFLVLCVVHARACSRTSAARFS